MPAPERARLTTRQIVHVEDLPVIKAASDFAWDLCRQEAREAAKGLVAVVRRKWTEQGDNEGESEALAKFFTWLEEGSDG